MKQKIIRKSKKYKSFYSLLNERIPNDFDGEIVNFFRVLRDSRTLAKLLNRAWASPCSREKYYRCKRLIKAIEYS